MLGMVLGVVLGMVLCVVSGMVLGMVLLESGYYCIAHNIVHGITPKF